MVEMDDIFSDGMMLQRERENEIYGWDMPKVKVSLEFCGEVFSCISDADGYWSISIPSRLYGGPYEMLITGTTEKSIQDIYVGDVFFLGGQSNMELPLSRVWDLYGKEIEADRLVIRQFTMPKEPRFELTEKMPAGGQWTSIKAKGKEVMSALGYFFAKKRQEVLGEEVPIGLIQGAVGGSPIESWCKPSVIETFGDLYNQQLSACRIPGYIDNVTANENKGLEQWWAPINCLTMPSLPLEGKDDWAEIQLPVMYERVPQLDGMSGVVWLHRTFNLSEEDLVKNESWRLEIGTIVDADKVWVNEHLVGRTDYRYPPRKYPVRKGQLRAGENHVLIKQVITQGMGGVTPTKPMHLMSDNRRVLINLKGAWQYKIGFECKKAPTQTFFNWMPTALYHAMVYPIRRISLSGILWYQGESNAGKQLAMSYGDVFKKMIHGFREAFDDGNLPFVFVQLAGFEDTKDNGGVGSWVILRREQEKALELPFTAMAVAADMGERMDIHPVRKKPVGERLAMAYGDCIRHGEVGMSFKYAAAPSNDKTLITITISGRKWVQRGETKFSVVADGEEKILVGKRISESGFEIEWQGKDINQVGYAQEDYPDISLYTEDGRPIPPFIIDVMTNRS